MDQLRAQTGDNYDPAIAFPPDQSTVQIVFDVGNEPVLVRFLRFVDGAVESYLDPQEVLFVPSIGNVIGHATGIQWRSAVAGKSAVIIAKRSTIADVQITPGTPYDGIVSTSGTIQPGGGGGGTTSMIFQHNGTTVATEGTVDFEDGAAAGINQPQVLWTVVDDPGNSRVKVTPVVVDSLTSVLAYVEFTSNVTVSGVSEAGATSIVSAGAVTFDGATPVMISGYSEGVDAGAAAYDLTIFLFDGGSSIGQMAEFIQPGASLDRRPMFVARRFTPSAGAHTYSIRGARGATNVTVHAGVGGVGAVVPGFIHVAYDV